MRPRPDKGHCVRLAALTVGSVLVLCATDAAAQTPAVWLGTWKLDVAKSLFRPGPPPRSQVIRNVSSNGDGFTSTTEMVNTESRALHTEFFARPDGKVFMEGRTSYSRDGKTRTQTYTRLDAKRQRFESTAVFGRQ